MFQRKKGSITVETAAILPFFVCFLVFILYFFRILQVQSCVAQALSYTGRKIAAEYSLELYQTEPGLQSDTEVMEPQEQGGNQAVGLLGATVLFQKELKKQNCPIKFIRGGILGITLLQSDFSGDYVELKATYRMKFPIRLLGNLQYQIAQSAKCRKWTGYHPGQDGYEEDDWLYYTQYGRVYHTSRSCSYLDLSIHGIPDLQRGNARNASGGKYHACPYCGKGAVYHGMVYITNYGDCYHTSLTCSGLKRSVFMIRRSKATEKQMCSKCGNGRS